MTARILAAGPALLAALTLVALPAAAGTTKATTTAATPTGDKKVTTTGFYSFSVKTIDGKPTTLAAYKGKALLVVNTASKCGFTPQYKGLEALYDRYKARGFEVLAFPANNFMGQEPGTNEEIQTFCTTKYDVTFPLFSKISVKGKDIDPLYAWLTKESGFPGDIEWNFAKFLVDPEGKVVARYKPQTSPDDKKLVATLESILPGK
jgi:glutathione peroxidase